MIGRLLVVMALVVVAVGLAGCGGASKTAEPSTSAITPATLVYNSGLVYQEPLDGKATHAAVREIRRRGGQVKLVGCSGRVASRFDKSALCIVLTPDRRCELWLFRSHITGMKPGRNQAARQLCSGYQGGPLRPPPK